MGVRNLVSEFNGTGYSVTLDGPVAPEFAQAAQSWQYGDPVPTRTLAGPGNAQFRIAMERAVAACMERIGFVVVAGRHGFEGSWSSREFSAIARSSLFQVGCRSLLNDFVVAVGPSQAFESKARYPTLDEWGVFLSHGMSAKGFKEAYDSLAADVADYIRLSLMQADVGRLPDSPDSQAPRYELPPDADARIDALVATIEDATRRLTRPVSHALASSTPEERVEIAKALLGLRPEDTDEDSEDWDDGAADPAPLPTVVVPTYVPGGTAMLWEPGKPDVAGLPTTVPGELRDYMDTLPAVNGVVPIPFDERTAAWFAARQEKAGDDHVIVSAEQYAGLTEEDCWIPRMDRDGRRRGVVVIHPAPDLAPVPAP